MRRLRLLAFASMGALAFGCSSSTPASDASDAGAGDEAASAGDAATGADGGACQPSCGGHTCGDDGCGGSCGTCGTKSCQNGTCVDVGSCKPTCSSTRTCGDDGCGGTCGSCAADKTCQNGTCVAKTCTPACAGHTCGPDGCGGTCGTCDSTHHCDNGACVPGGCTPNCLARQCGPDGCGGSCGTCNASFATCSSTYGLCVPNGAPAGLTVTWGQACWQLWCDARFPGSPPRRYQAIFFDHNMSFPIEGTLYANKICDPSTSSVGWNSDNLNDTGQATPPSIGEMWFINHPDVVPSSAVWWLGDHSSGCIDYSSLPDCPGGAVGCP